MFSSMLRSEDTIGNKTQGCWTQLSPCTRWWACSCTKSDPRKKLPNNNETYFQLTYFSQQKTTNHRQQHHNYYTTMFQKTSLGSSMLTTKISGLTDALYSGKRGAGIKCRSPSIEFWVTRSDALIVSSLWFYVHLEIDNWNNTPPKKGTWLIKPKRRKVVCICCWTNTSSWMVIPNLSCFSRLSLESDFRTSTWSASLPTKSSTSWHVWSCY